ncbi:MAG: hypothetical protein KGL35_12830 [Bradyrhizobium sp.]|nr:hypothetical protein [Pseudomonadota bacterium]MDE2469595.1 hypothetical protein [Bradyrhizobium sp.]
MNNYIARANIDHYLELLNKDEIPSNGNSMIGKLLIEEENKLSHDLEQLEFAESRATACRDRVSHLTRLRECFAAGSSDRVQAERMLANFEDILRLIEGFSDQMRKRVNDRAL